MTTQSLNWQHCTNGHDPALGEDLESFCMIRALDDFGFEVRQDAGQAVVKARPLIGRISKEFPQEGIHSKHGGKQHNATVAILDVSAVNDRVEQQTQRIYENVALLALDFLARIIPMRINPRPPFSALFTLWLSMMAGVGLGFRL